MKKIDSIIYCIMLSMIFTQVIITVDDMKYDVGGYYSMYNFPAPQGVIGLTGNIGGPQVFDFSEGVTASTLAFTYVDLNDGGHGGSFPGADIAEKRVDGNDESWMYLKFEDGIDNKFTGGAYYYF